MLYSLLSGKVPFRRNVLFLEIAEAIVSPGASGFVNTTRDLSARPFTVPLISKVFSWANANTGKKAKKGCVLFSYQSEPNLFGMPVSQDFNNVLQAKTFGVKQK